ncbi:ribonuclease P protein subunit p21 [Mustelus asterias]
MTGVKDKEAFQRLNFLYQAAHCVLAQNPENEELARFYCYTQRTISKRLVLRQDPSVKRTICKCCSSLLLPGQTATTVRQRKRGQQMTIVRCLSCGLTKRFPRRRGYSLWVEQPESQLPAPALTPAETGQMVEGVEDGRKDSENH